MSGTLGRVEDFDGNKDDWQQYVERLKHFFVANGIDGAEKKRAVFLSVIGDRSIHVQNSPEPAFSRQAWGQVVRKSRGHAVQTLQAGTAGDRRTFPFQ